MLFHQVGNLIYPFSIVYKENSWPQSKFSVFQRMVFFFFFFQYFDFIEERFYCLKNTFYIWRKHFSVNFHNFFSPNSLCQQMVYFQYFDFIEVAIFYPQKNFTLEKKNIFLYFFSIFFPPM